MEVNSPKVSIITVVYNGETVIEETLLSVINQNYSNKEYIIIDGASTDNTRNIINKYHDQIELFSEPDKGVYDAMNRGIDKATGDWIIFMNAGDKFYSESVITEVMSQSISYEQYSVIYGDAEFTLKNIAYINEAAHEVSSNQYMPFSHQASFTRTRILKSIKFDLNYKIAADTAFFLQLVKEGHQMKHVPITICSYNALEGLSADNDVERCKEIVRLQAKWNGINPDSSHFKQFVKDAKKRQYIKRIIPNFLWIYLREQSIKKRYKPDKIREIG